MFGSENTRATNKQLKYVRSLLIEKYGPEAGEERYSNVTESDISTKVASGLIAKLSR